MMTKYTKLILIISILQLFFSCGTQWTTQPEWVIYKEYHYTGQSMTWYSTDYPIESQYIITNIDTNYNTNIYTNILINFIDSIGGYNISVLYPYTIDKY